MATVKDLTKRFNVAFKTIESRKVKEAVGELAVDKIRVRTRLGYGVDKTGGKRSKLAPLSTSYKLMRRKSLKKKLSTQTRPAKSNLTLTGSMLDSIAYRISGSKINIFIRGKENNKKLNWAEDGSSKPRRPKRKFFRISDSEQKQIRQLVEREISRALQKAF